MSEPATLAELHELYRRTHAGNPKRFLGYTTKLYVEPIKRLIEETGATSLLDFGCGKGYQYLGGRRIHERWGGLLPWCYDPGVIGLNEPPQRTFDGVISCDVMEHVPEPLIDEILGQIFGYADKFVLLGIATVPSHKSLADGTLAHVTVKPPEWWMDRIGHAAHLNATVARDCDQYTPRWEAWFTDYSKIARPGK